MYMIVTGRVLTDDLNIAKAYQSQHAHHHSKYSSNHSSSSSISSSRPHYNNVSHVLAHATLYFSPNWDMLLHEIDLIEKEKALAYFRIRSGIALSIARDILSQQWAYHTQQQNNHIEVYVHRICLEPQNTTCNYLLLCSNKHKVFTYVVGKEDMPTVNILERHNQKGEKNIIYYSSAESEWLSRENQSILNKIYPLPLHLSQQLDQETKLLERKVSTNDAASHLQFIYHRNVESNLLINKPLIYPKSARTEIPITFTPIYDAFLLKIRSKFIELSFFLEDMSIILDDVDKYLAQITHENENKFSLENQLQIYKNYIASTRSIVSQIKDAVRDICEKKTFKNDILALLKARILWVIQESIRQYYILMSDSVKKEYNYNKSKEFITTFNNLFKPSALINQSSRLIFNDLSKYSLDQVIDVYNKLINNIYQYAQKSTSHSEFFKTNIQRVHQDLINDIQYFGCTPLYFIKKTPKYYELKELSDSHIIKDYYPQEQKIIYDNLKLLSNFVGFAVEENLRSEGACQLLENHMICKEKEIHTIKKSATELLSQNSVLRIPRLIEPVSQAARSPNRDEIPSNATSSTEGSRVAQLVLNIVQYILNDKHWWHSQLSGLFPGTCLQDIKVPHGIYMMATAVNTRVHESPVELLRHYQSLARQRLRFCVKANFFPIRKDGTKIFYQLIDKLDISSLTTTNAVDFNNFLINNMGKFSYFSKNNRNDTTHTTYPNIASPTAAASRCS